jgi:hypothetical protein
LARVWTKERRAFWGWMGGGGGEWSVIFGPFFSSYYFSCREWLKLQSLVRMFST